MNTEFEITEIGDCDILKLHGGPFSDGDEFIMWLSGQIVNGVEEYWFTVSGKHDRKPVQFDFDDMPRSALEDIRAAIDLILASPNAELPAAQSEPLLRDLSRLLSQASAYCCHHAPQHGPDLPHVVEIKFADIRSSTACYHLLSEIKDTIRPPNADLTGNQKPGKEVDHV